MEPFELQHNRERLLSEAVMQKFFSPVLRVAESQKLASDEHFTVDGTLIEAWASMKSFSKKDGSGKPPKDGGRNPTVDFKGGSRSNDTHHPTTDGDARLFKKGDGDKSRLCYMGQPVMENRHGPVVDVETTRASGTAEREAALTMSARTVHKAGETLGADKGYDAAEFVKDLPAAKITPHVTQKNTVRSTAAPRAMPATRLA